MSEREEIRRRVREAAPEARRDMRDLVREQRERWADEREREAAAERLAALAAGAERFDDLLAGRKRREGPQRPPVQGPEVPTTVEQWARAVAQGEPPKPAPPAPPAAPPEVLGPTVAPRRFRPL